MLKFVNILVIPAQLLGMHNVASEGCECLVSFASVHLYVCMWLDVASNHISGYISDKKGNDKFKIYILDIMEEDLNLDKRLRMCNE